MSFSAATKVTVRALRGANAHLFYTVPHAPIAQFMLEASTHLPAEEQERALKYRSLEKRRQYLSSRLCLRRLLSEYLGCSPADVPLHRDNMGRPCVSDGKTELLRVSMSHTSQLTAIAIAGPEVSVGIDVETEIESRAMAAVMNVAAAPAERRWLSQIPADHRPGQLTRLWTIKEAALKAVGCGLTIPLGEIEVHGDSETPALRGLAAGADLSRFQAQCFEATPAGSMRRLWGAVVTGVRSADSPSIGISNSAASLRRNISRRNPKTDVVAPCIGPQLRHPEIEIRDPEILRDRDMFDDIAAGPTNCPLRGR